MGDVVCEGRTILWCEVPSFSTYCWGHSYRKQFSSITVKLQMSFCCHLQSWYCKCHIQQWCSWGSSPSITVVRLLFKG